LAESVQPPFNMTNKKNNNQQESEFTAIPDSAQETLEQLAEELTGRFNLRSATRTLPAISYDTQKANRDDAVAILERVYLMGYEQGWDDLVDEYKWHYGM